MIEKHTFVYLLGPSELDRHAYRLLLNEELGLAVDAQSDFSAVAVWSAMRSKPALALAIADHPRQGVREALDMIPRLWPQTRILVVSSAMDEAILREWGACELCGYVLKDGGISEFRTALEAVMAGDTYFSPGVFSAIEKGRRSTDGYASLSPRELELLPLLAKGLTLREAASTMTVSYKTADSYRTTLLRKLGVRDRVELARYAIREGIIEA